MFVRVRTHGMGWDLAGHTITEGHALQTSPGKYNEEIFTAFDFILVRIRTELN